MTKPVRALYLAVLVLLLLVGAAFDLSLTQSVIVGVVGMIPLVVADSVTSRRSGRVNPRR